jgi:hypothetical protein
MQRRSRVLEAQVRVELAALGAFGAPSAAPTPRGGLGGGFRLHQGRRNEGIPIANAALHEVVVVPTPCKGLDLNPVRPGYNASVRRAKILPAVTIEDVLEARKQQKPIQLAPLQNALQLCSARSMPRHVGSCAGSTGCCDAAGVEQSRIALKLRPNSKDGRSDLAASSRPSNYFREVDATYSELLQLSARTTGLFHQPHGGVTAGALIRIRAPLEPLEHLA